MGEVYFDCEVAYQDPGDVERLRQGTRGPQPTPDSCKIITVQYQLLDSRGCPSGELQVFKEWESSEEEIVKKAFQLINPQTKWEVIPVGQNLLFDLGMLRGRAARYGIDYKEWFMYNELPRIDIKDILLGMNSFQFKGSGLDKFTGKESSGISVPIWYSQGEYQKIMDYIIKETKEFIEFYSKLKLLLPKFREEHGFF